MKVQKGKTLQTRERGINPITPNDIVESLAIDMYSIFIK